MAQLYKKTGTCSRPSGAQTDYPMYLVVGESNDAPLCFSPALWLDASDADSITIVSDKVTQWADKSGNARHAVQATADNQPVVGSETIDGKNTIQFDGASDYLTVSSFPTGASAYSMYAVLKIDNDPPTNATRTGFLTFDGDSSLVAHYPYTDSKVYADFATTARKTVGIPSPSLASAHLLNFDSAASLWTCRINGTQIYATTTNTVGISSATNYIGKSGNYFDGDFAEILIFPSVLSIQNRLIVEGYLAHKWGLESSLPTGHPYKTNAPVTVSCDGHCKSDFGDIRFHDSTDAELKYMIDWGTLTGTTPNQSVGVWVKTNPGTSATTVVLKYGDAALSDGSCAGTDIFIKFKDFESGDDGTSLSTADADWTVVQGACEIDTAQKFAGTKSALLHGIDGTYALATLPVTPSAGIAISLKIRKPSAASGVVTIGHGDGSSRAWLYYGTSLDYDGVYTLTSAGAYSSLLATLTGATWHTFELKNFNWTADTYDLYVDGTLVAEGATEYADADAANALFLRSQYYGSYGDCWIDDVIVRKYASPEPTWGTWGAEEAFGFNNLLDGKVTIISPGAPSNILDGKAIIESTLTDLLDGKAWIEFAGADLLDGAAQIIFDGMEYLDGAARIQSSATDLLDGKVWIEFADTSLLDGKAFVFIQNIEVSGYYLFDDIVDLEGIFQSRLTAHIAAGGMDLQSNLYDYDDLYLIDNLYGNIEGLFSVGIELAMTDDDPLGVDPAWTDWRSFLVGDYTARAYKFRLLMSGTYPNVTPVVQSVEITIDMPDRIIGFEATVLTTGVRIVFDPPFFAIPEIGISVIDGQEGDKYTITSKDESGFNIAFTNGGSPVERVISGVAKAYGAKETAT